MLLEVSYGWSPELCGASFVVIGAASVLLMAVSSRFASCHTAVASK